MWGIWALVTWQPAREMYRKAMRLRITFLESEASAIPEATIPEKAGSIADKGIFDFQAEVEAATENIAKTQVQITKDTGKFGGRLVKYTNRMVKTKTGPQKLKLSGKLAQDIQRYANTLGISGSELQRNGTQLSESMLAWLRDEKTLAIEGPQPFRDFSQTVEGLRKATEAARDANAFARQVLGSMKGFSQEVNSALDNLDKVYDVNIAAMQTIEDFCQEAKDTITDVLGD